MLKAAHDKIFNVFHLHVMPLNRGIVIRELLEDMLEREGF